MFEYIKTGKYFAQIAGGLEAHAKEELITLGAEIIQEVPRGIRFACDTENSLQDYLQSKIDSKSFSSDHQFRLP